MELKCEKLIRNNVIDKIDEAVSALRTDPDKGHSDGVSWLDRRVARRLLRSVSNLPIALRLWNDEELTSEPASFAIKLHARSALYRLVLDPVVGFGDLYSSGRLEFHGDLVRFFEALYRLGADQRLGWARSLGAISRIRNPKRIIQCKRDIWHHYDLDSDFYRLWLDREGLQYTCGYFPEPEMGLEQAQVAKMHHICRKLALKPGLHVIEAGSGWGGLALFMAKHYGVTVQSYNISRQQVAFARRRVAEDGLAQSVEYIEDDYRNIAGRCDVFVSVGMLEHVGLSHYPELGRVIDGCLSPDGRGLLHSIARDSPADTNAWIEKRIFPNTYAPSLAEMVGLFAPWAISVLDVENLRIHYVQTLRHWLQRFERHKDAISTMHGDGFARAWRLYLSGSKAAFSCGDLQLFQVVFARSQVNALPWTRAGLYFPGGRSNT